MSLTIEVKGVIGKVRLDQFLKRALKEENISFRRLITKIKDKGVIVNGRLIKKKSWLVENGDKIELLWNLPKVEFSPLPASDLNIKILYEDEAVLLLHKESGIKTYPLEPDERDTLANAIITRYPMIKGIGYKPQQAGILYRLDTDTSGIVIVCKTASIFNSLRQLMKSGKVKKEYIAMVFGTLEKDGYITYPIATKGRNSEKVIVLKEKNYDPNRYHSVQPATTYYQVWDRANNATLLKIRITVGRRHQIRAHLSSIGHPIVGDKIYSKFKVPETLGRLFLHATKVTFPHPLSGKKIKVGDPLPPELNKFWNEVKTGKINITKYMVEKDQEGESQDVP